MKIQAWNTVAILFFSISAGAMVRPGWERPVFRAEMQATDRQAGSMELIMTHQDGQKDPTGLVLMIEDRRYEFVIESSESDACGSARHVAYSMALALPFGSRPAKIELVDHSYKAYQANQADSASDCGARFSGIWEATLESSGREGEPMRMKLVGDPEPIYSIL
ncbi:MAG: hypothetical protein NDJ89_10350 [Oligoflexia bacterium]|nr:hypothetical protein [Oligoflexia bacterium]